MGAGGGAARAVLRARILRAVRRAHDAAGGGGGAAFSASCRCSLAPTCGSGAAGSVGMENAAPPPPALPSRPSTVRLRTSSAPAELLRGAWIDGRCVHARTARLARGGAPTRRSHADRWPSSPPVYTVPVASSCARPHAWPTCASSYVRTGTPAQLQQRSVPSNAVDSTCSSATVPRQLTIGPVCPRQLRMTRGDAPGEPSATHVPSSAGSAHSLSAESKPPDASRRQSGESHTPRIPLPCRASCSTACVASSQMSTRPSSDDEARMSPRMHTPYTGPRCPAKPLTRGRAALAHARSRSARSR